MRDEIKGLKQRLSEADEKNQQLQIRLNVASSSKQGSPSRIKVITSQNFEKVVDICILGTCTTIMYKDMTMNK